MRQDGQDGLAEIGEPFGVVVIAVEGVALEIVFVVDEEARHAVDDEFIHADVLAAPRQVHRSVVEMLHLVPVDVGNGGVFGQDQGRFEALLAQFFRQGAHHVGQAACFDKGRRFGSNK